MKQVRDTRKAADYGDKPKKLKPFGQISKVVSNNQCKKCKTNDARDTKYK